ncbi:MAG: hypothetical protein EOO53_06470 [Gammaproteobacteria bacterium]|nr:MAG: hypothetical protein EOO53_06470 [Gammaproteobacteria bacterium]
MTNETAENVLPWYRQFWFWFVFGPLIFIIVLCFFTVSIAFNFADDVVTDNYYKSGLMINQTLKQDEKAAELKLVAHVKFDQTTGDVLVSLAGNHAFPKNLYLFLDNPVKSKKDQNLLLTAISAGEYRGQLDSPVEYSWYIALVPESDASKRKDAEWLLSGEINLAKTTETVLQSRTNTKPAE